MTNTKSLTDEELVDLVRKQDQELYAHIVHRYQQKLMRYAHYLVSDEVIAEDVVQTAFIRAFENLQGFNTKKKFSSWIYRIVHNQAINTLKKNQKTINLKIDHWHQIGSDHDLEKEFSQKQLKNMVKKSIDKLPLKYKAPVSLYFLEDRSYEEISDILKIPVSTVGTRIRRGKIMLKPQLEERKSYAQ